jgi:hypothetical protein
MREIFERLRFNWIKQLTVEARPLDDDPEGGGTPLPTFSCTVTSPDGLTTNVAVTATGTAGISSLELRRSFSSSFSSATLLSILSVVAGTQIYHDTDPAIVQQKVWYWVVANGSLLKASGYISLTTPLPPVPLDSFDASHDAVVNGASKINIVVDPPSGSDVGSVRVRVNGYKGVARDVIVAQDLDSKFSFNLEQTGEIVTLKASVLNSAGDDGYDLGNELTKVLTLDAPATVPTKPVISRATCFANGVQVDVEAGLEASITSYKLYRQPRGGGAQILIATVKSTGEPIVSLFDPNGDAVTYQWYVSAVNATGEGALSDAVFDPTAY